MCVLRLSSKENSFKPILEKTKLSLFPVLDIGEYRDVKKSRVCEINQATLHISNKEWNDLEGQIEDVVCFIESNRTELQQLFKLIEDLNADLDFPIISKHDGNIISQGINFPSKLTSLVGNLNIGIGMTYYENDFFD